MCARLAAHLDSVLAVSALLRRVDAIIIHHTASPASSTTLEDVDAWHKARGFRWEHGGKAGHIGYHYLVTFLHERAEVQRGRPLDIQGAHTLGGWNSRSIGVCVAGSYEHVGWHGVPLDQRRVLLDLLGSLCIQYDLWPEHVLGHREAQPGHTVCPGFDPEAVRLELRRRLRPIGPGEVPQ